MNKYAAGAILLLMFTFTFVVSCTKIDNSLGGTLVPDDQQMTMGIAEINGIDAYQTMFDSILTSNITNAGYVGTVTSPLFGKTWAAFGCQYISHTIYDGELSSTTKPDSLVISLFFGDVAQGDTSKTQIINVYELKKRLYRDTSSYAFFDVAAIADMSEPLFSFNYKGTPGYIPLSLTSNRAKALMNKLIDTTGGVYSSSDKWYERFPGLYFVPANSSPQDASIISLELDSTRMSLYARNYTDASFTKVKDTLSVDMKFNNTYDYPNGSVNQFKHDYSGTGINPALFNDTLTTSSPLDVTYTQGMSGLATYLRFSDEFIAEIKSKIVAPYKSLAINKALLEIAVGDPTADHLNQFIARIGLYSKYNNLIGIVDYDTDRESSGMTIPYGGYLNRTFNNYQMDISSFVQKMITDKYPAKTMVMGPSKTEQLSIRGSVFDTSNKPDKPKIKVTLTYTLVR